MNEYQWISYMDIDYHYTDNSNNNNNNSSNSLNENLNNSRSYNFDNNTQLLTLPLPSSSSSSSSSITINSNYSNSNSNGSSSNNNININNIQQYLCNDGIISTTNAIASAITASSSTTTNSVTSDATANAPSIPYELNIPYVVLEILVAICAIIGNLMVIIVFQRERKLRRRTNYYIVSLAMADFLVGSLGVPFAILASIGLPTNLYACLFTVSLLVVLCTISIFCLVAVSIDRYWAILYPMAYSRNVRTRTAIGIISMCWLAGLIVGFLPLFGWHAALDEPQHGCLFVEVMDYSYLVFLNFATIITPAFLMLAFYAHIYKVIIKQVRQIVTMNPRNKSTNNNNQRAATSPPTIATIQKSKKLTIKSSKDSPHIYHGQRSQTSGTMLRVLGAARKRDVKATQNLAIIVLFFMICWIPLYTINCIEAFCPSCNVHPKLTLFCIILSHLNSAVNPILYAYHLKDFRLALKNLILRMLGIEVTQPLDTLHRYSMASQRRLQPLEISARHLHSRIYIDSPIWLRQQQQQLQLQLEQQKQQQQEEEREEEDDREGEGGKKLNNLGLIKPCLNNIHQNVVTAVVAPLMEVAKSSKLKNDGMPMDIDIDMITTTISRDSVREHCDSPYSYDNKSYTPSVDGLELAKLQFKMEYSFSDYEITYNRLSPSKCDANNENDKPMYYATPPLVQNRKRLIKRQRRRPKSISSSEEYLNDSQLFAITVNQKQATEQLSPLAFIDNEPKSKNRNNSHDLQKTMASQDSLCDQKSSLQSVTALDKADHGNYVKLNADINLQYYTLLQQRSIRSREKFSPFKSGCNLSQLIVSTKKHSSLFHLFYTEPQIIKQIDTNNKLQQQQQNKQQEQQHQPQQQQCEKQQQQQQQKQLANDCNKNSQILKTANDCNSHKASCALLIDSAPSIGNESLVCKSPFHHSHMPTVNS